MRRISNLSLSNLLPGVLFWVLGVQAGAAGSATALSDGSFEGDEMTPTGWRAERGGEWARGLAHSGERSIGGKSRKGGVVWRSDPIRLEAKQSYRLDGWIGARRGQARLGMDLLDAHGRTLATAATMAVSEAGGQADRPGWRYVALERDLPEGAASARIWLNVRDEAYLDDVNLVPLVSNMLFNPGFDGDNRQRVTYWDEDPLFSMPGAKAGSHRADPEGGRSGSALLIEADTSWWAVRNVSSPVPTGLTTFRLSGWARAEKGQPEIRIVWLDYGGTILGMDLAEPAETVDGWTRYEVSAARAPEEANLVTVTNLVRDGKAWFDDFELHAVAPAANKRPVVKVHVNQVGYERSWPKSLVVETNFFPERAVRSELEIVSPEGRQVMRLPLVPSGRINDGTPDDWGAYFWRVDFLDLEQPGTYRAVAHVGDARGESPAFLVGEDVLFRETASLGVEFFFVQRCGFDVPGWHGACHLDDARLPDGTHIDAVGGWHSAGDYNKLMYENGDGGVAFALVEAYDAAPEFFAGADRDGDGLPDVLDEAKWGADFVAKMQIPETGALRKDVSQGPGRNWMKWSPPDVHTDNIVGTDDDPVILPGEGSSPLVIGAWVHLAKLLDERGIENDYRGRAVRLWNHATASGTKGHGPHLLLSAMEMHRATGEQGYLDFARQSVEAMVAGQVADGPRSGAFGSYGEYAAGALASFALVYPDDPLEERIRPALLKYLAFCERTAENPFGLGKQMVGDPEFFFEPTSSYGHNFELFARAWAATLIFRLTGEMRAARFAADQIDWVFGKNPFGLCMFEGEGTVNPPRYHHRYNSIPGHERGAVPGAIPNGFVRSAKGLDQPGFDLSRSRKERPHPSYRTSEPWLVHNMWHLLTVSEVSRATKRQRSMRFPAPNPGTDTR